MTAPRSLEKIRLDASIRRRSLVRALTLLLVLFAGGSGCSDQAACRTFDLKTVHYNSSAITIGTIPAGTRVDVCPTYIIIRRPANETSTIVPMTHINAIDIK